MEELEKKLDDIKKNIEDIKNITNSLIIQKEVLERINSISDTDKIDKEVVG